MAIKDRIKEETYLRGKDGGITALSGGLAEVPEGRDDDVIPADVALAELVADAEADAKFIAEQNKLASELKKKRIDALRNAEDFESFKAAYLELIGA